MYFLFFSCIWSTQYRNYKCTYTMERDANNHVDSWFVHCRKFQSPWACIFNGFDSVHNETTEAESHTQTSANKQINLIAIFLSSSLLCHRFIFSLRLWPIFYLLLESLCFRLVVVFPIYCNFVWCVFFFLFIHTHYAHYAVQNVQTFVVFGT